MTADPRECCAPGAPATPVAIENRPGLSEITHRVGTFTSFREAMLRTIAETPELAPLRTRAGDDQTITVLELWAALADVLTFYQERIANEGFLRPARHRDSVQHLVRLIDYQLRPGAAATGHLAFTVEPDSVAQLPEALRVQSVPVADEPPQKYETLEAIEARAAWNALGARLGELRWPRAGDTSVWLQGTATNLRPGDRLLFVGEERLQSPSSERWDLRRVKTVEPDEAAARTRVSWDTPLTFSLLPMRSEVHALRERAAIFGHNAPVWRTLPDLAKANYIGLKDPRELIEGDRPDYPDFVIFAPASTKDAEPRKPHRTKEEVAEAFSEAAKEAAAAAAKHAFAVAVPAAIAAFIAAAHTALGQLRAVEQALEDKVALIKAFKDLKALFDKLTNLNGDVPLAEAFNALRTLIGQIVRLEDSPLLAQQLKALISAVTGWIGTAESGIEALEAAVAGLQGQIGGLEGAISSLASRIAALEP